LLPSSSLLQEDSVHLLRIITSTEGSVCDETCPRNQFLWEGLGHPARAASQLSVQRAGAAPALAAVPRPPSSQSQSLNEQERCFSSAPMKTGWISPVLCYTLSNKSRPPHLPPGSTPATHASPAPPSQLPARVSPRGMTPLSFPLPPARGWDRRAAAAFRVRSSCPTETRLFLAGKSQQNPFNGALNERGFCHLCAPAKHQRGVILRPEQCFAKSHLPQTEPRPLPATVSIDNLGKYSPKPETHT